MKHHVVQLAHINHLPALRTLVKVMFFRLTQFVKISVIHSCAACPFELDSLRDEIPSSRNIGNRTSCDEVSMVYHFGRATLLCPRSREMHQNAPKITHPSIPQNELLLIALPIAAMSANAPTTKHQTGIGSIMIE
jgi:hypothetical protein